MEIKPKLRKLTDSTIWICRGDGVETAGYSLKEAYRKWNRKCLLQFIINTFSSYFRF